MTTHGDHIDVIPAWAAKRDVATWAYLCRRYAADRREWKQRAREAEAENARLTSVLEAICLEYLKDTPARSLNNIFTMTRKALINKETA